MGSKRIGPYEVLRKLGSGGMGSVYLALDEDGRTVAVKVIHPHIAEDMNGLKRLAREVEAMKRVVSPYVAELLDADLTGPYPFIVTRYVQGRSLREIVGRRGALPLDALRKLEKGLIAALDAIHGVDVVHRDLTPNNVVIADGVPVVIDFGIAQAFDATRITQTMIGTAGYVAPEVIRGERAGPPADVFSWAATMAFAATAKPCFGGKNIMEVLQRTLESEPDLTGFPRELLPSVWRGLRKDPAERPSIGGLIAGAATFAPETEWPVAPTRRTSASRIPGLWAAAGEARKKGQLDRAQKLYEEVRQIAVDSQDPGAEMFALYQLGSAAEFCGDHDLAQERYEQALHVARSMDAAPIQVLTLRGLEQVAGARGDVNGARTYAERARQVLDKRYKQGYPRPVGADSEPFLRPWVRG